ncbi:leucine-rich repeat flightless-interacting protein 2-like [Oppia nitens]|uniref:leucine-rich repeat flightless-interacting protein 2-like n=1 Tax=Oppia nitens TaxID=1686743 RepID=UPI0023DB7F07|nr:leucine-rich repeat flightless-interacting protein 2-like [Oppia nitens]
MSEMTTKLSALSSASELPSARNAIQGMNTHSNRFFDQLHKLQELDDNLKKAMVNNAQLDNEKQSFAYQVDIFKDDIEEMTENLVRLQKDYRDKSRSFELMNRDFKKLQKDCDYYKQCLKQRDYLIEEAGLVLLDSDETNNGLQVDCQHMSNGLNTLNGDLSDRKSEITADESGSESGVSSNAIKISTNMSLISREAAQLLEGIDGISLESKITILLKDKKLLKNEINQLKSELEEERQRALKFDELTQTRDHNIHSLNSDTSVDLQNIQRETNKLISDYKFKLKKYEQEISVLNGNVARLETQLTRFRTTAVEAEKLEDELKADKRKTQRELREALARIEELETSNAHLQKRIDKLKSNRNIVIQPNSK